MIPITWVCFGDTYIEWRCPSGRLSRIDALEKSTWARDVLGEDVVSHYLHFFKTEQRKFDSVVTDYERRRYFEQA